MSDDWIVLAFQSENLAKFLEENQGYKPFPARSSPRSPIEFRFDEKTKAVKLKAKLKLADVEAHIFRKV